MNADDLEIERLILEDSGSVADEHLAQGNPVYYVDSSLPMDSKIWRIVKEYPCGKLEIVAEVSALKTNE